MSVGIEKSGRLMDDREVVDAVAVEVFPRPDLAGARGVGEADALRVIVEPTSFEGAAARSEVHVWEHSLVCQFKH